MNIALAAGLAAFVLFLLPAASASGETVVDRKVSLGGKLATGNTELQSVSLDFRLNRNRRLIDETTLKGRFDRESADGLETAYKLYGSARYARSWDRNLYNYYKLEAQHDRFQDIGLRLIPTLGVGYWFETGAESSAMVEAAAGYQWENLISQGVNDLLLLTFSANYDHGPFSDDFDFYQAADDLANYRFTNLAKLTAKLNGYFSLKLSLKEEYNNRPAAGVEHNDLTLTVGVEFTSKSATE